MSATIVGLMNPAGSSAKSTTAAALSHLAAQAGRRVLAIDVDPQANLTMWLGGSRDTAGITQAIRAVVANDPSSWPGVDPEEVAADLHRQVRRAVQHTRHGVDLIAADPGLRGLVRGWQSLRETDPDLLLRELAAALGEEYDLIVFDCKGDLGVLTEAALLACHDVIAISTPTTKLLEGMQLLRAEVAKHAHVQLRTLVPSVIRPRSRGADADDLYRYMREAYADQVTSPIRGVASLEGAYGAGEPITAYDPTSPVSEDFARLYGELVQRGVL